LQASQTQSPCERSIDDDATNEEIVDDDVDVDVDDDVDDDATKKGEEVKAKPASQTGRAYIADRTKRV
jgi:hypothetical protein